MMVDSNESGTNSTAPFAIPSQPSKKATIGHDSNVLSDSGLVCNGNEKVRKRRRQQDNKDAFEFGSESEDDSEENPTTTANNPVDLIARWPSLGSGKHSPWRRTFAELEKRPPMQSDSQSPTPTFLWSDMVVGNKKNDAVNAMLAVVKTELRKEDRLLHNVIVSGLAEPEGEYAKAEEDSKVQNLLKELEIEATTVKRKKRLRKPGRNPDPLKPSLLLIEFNEQATVEKAVANAKKLAKTDEFRRVYVNRDRTEADRIAEANLRKERNEKNKSLPYVLDESSGLRHDLDEKTNKKYYWGIRGGELAKVFINEDNRGIRSENKSTPNV